MKPEKAEQLFKLMKQYGVEHFKNADLEIRLGHTEMAPIKPSSNTKTASSDIAPNIKVPDPQAIPPVEMAIPHHVNEVANLLRLNDNELVDKLFPDYTQVSRVGE